MRRHPLAAALGSVFAIVVVVQLLLWVSNSSGAASEAQPIDRLPAIFPDYSDVVIPANVAPLNFAIMEQGNQYLVEIKSSRSRTLRISSRKSSIVIPMKGWKNILSESRGDKIMFDISVRHPEQGWQKFQSITNTVAEDEIDGFLAYRLIGPVYNMWRDMGIYQRDLSNYAESVIIHNETLSLACINCHTFNWGDPENFLFQVRSGEYGRPMTLIRDGKVTAIDTRTDASPLTAVYCSWHPNGRIVAMSGNRITQFFHTAGQEGREVFDHESDISLYDVETNTVTTTYMISDPDRLETYPNWSADGKHLYFCSGPQLPVERYSEIQYDLMRIGYDADSGTWGAPETIVSASDTGLSVTHPKPSPDGRYVLFCMCGHGNFSIIQATSDLYILDTVTNQYWRPDINSDDVESYHSWSSNSRWFVFSSKRRDGLLAKPYFCHVDETGAVSKPFLLPQKDPLFYDSFLKTYNVPELIKGPVRVSSRDISLAVWRKENHLKAQLDSTVEIPTRDQQESVPQEMPWRPASSER